MSDNIGEAVGAILGLTFGGLILLEMASQWNSSGPVNLKAWGVLFLIAAIIGALVLVYGVFSSLMR